MIHAITATWTFDEAKKKEALLRNCPKCRLEQIASERKINTPLTCDECGTEIRPKVVTDGEAEKNKQKSK